MIDIAQLRSWSARLRLQAGRLGRFSRLVLLRFRDDGCFAAAGALSYTTLVSLVPLLAISLAILSAFPIFDTLKEQALLLIFDAFVPRIGGTVESYITQFAEMAGKTTAVGVIVLAFTATMLLATIEDRLNAIWRVHAPRGWTLRITIYWTVLTLGPLLFVLALSLRGTLEAAGGSLVPEDAGKLLLLWLTRVAGIVPVVLESLALMGFYCLIPHGPVRWRDGLIGGLVGALLIEVNRLGFTLYLDHFNAYEAIYGALAAIPIFLLWMYLTWSVVLLGAEVAAAVPLWRSGEDFAGSVEPDFLAVGLAVLEALSFQARGGGAIGTRALARRIAAPDLAVATCVDRLATAGFVAVTVSGGFVLARDLTRASLREVQLAVEPDLPDHAVRRLRSSRGRLLEQRMAPLRQTEAEIFALPVAGFLADPPP